MNRPLAVITTASSGMGLELSKVFAENGYDLIIGEWGDEIFEAKNHLESLGTKVHAVQVNLASYKGVEHFHREILADGRPVDAVVINAAGALRGAFLETELDDEIKLINLNCVSTTHLTKRLLNKMADQRHGRLLLTSSMMVDDSSLGAVFRASKSFILSLGEALREEVKEYGISVTVLMPETHDAGLEFGQFDPREFAQEGFDAMMEGKALVTPGSLANKVLDLANRFLPENWKNFAQRFISESSSPEH